LILVCLHDLGPCFEGVLLQSLRLRRIKDAPRATLAVARPPGGGARVRLDLARGVRGKMAPVDRVLRVRRAVVEAVAPLPPEALARVQAAGRYLAEPAVARRAAPPFTCSAMDGYAVRAGDAAGPAALPVARVVYAGDLPGDPLRPGEAVRIFTGAPVPGGADAVVREEATERVGDRVRFRGPVRPGENLRAAGEDVALGGLALPAGTRLGPRQLGLLAAVGADELVVHRRARIALLSTGDELVRGRIPDSNGVVLEGLLAGIGAVVRSRPVADDPAAVEAAIAEALASSDAVVTTGGVSVGEHDCVPEALARLGADVRVHGVPMKPGKPFLFALGSGKPVLGLPGSPSACLVAFEVFARPALLRLAGATRLGRPAVRLPLEGGAEGRPGRARMLWAELTGDGRVRAIGRDAAQMRGPALADALLLVPEGTGDLADGEAVETWLLGDA